MVSLNLASVLARAVVHGEPRALIKHNLLPRFLSHHLLRTRNETMRLGVSDDISTQNLSYVCVTGESTLKLPCQCKTSQTLALSIDPAVALSRNQLKLSLGLGSFD
jgi:hypothetical protein